MLIDKFNTLAIWERNGERAPHKPLLILFALGEFLRTPHRSIPYLEVDKKLRELLEEFGPNRVNYHPEYPFWRLQKDGIWEVHGADKIVLTSSGDARKGDLIKGDITGSLSEEIRKELTRNPKLFPQIVQNILNAHFPATIHEDILQSIGIDLSLNVQVKLKRGYDFRSKILQAYEYRCSVCGFDVRLGHTPIALEAAHIKWHQAGGPDEEINGLALCALHHKLFDRGAFSLSENLEILVSDKANGAQGFKEWLLDYHGRKIYFPQRQTFYPKSEFTKWHSAEVFKGYSRELL
nr:HNH endonuclease [Desulfobulbaceae bacterium]